MLGLPNYFDPIWRSCTVVGTYCTLTRVSVKLAALVPRANIGMNLRIGMKSVHRVQQKLERFQVFADGYGLSEV